MKIDKNTDGIVQLSNGDYELNIDIISTETIEIDLDDRLLCKSIKSEQSIIVKKGIKAGLGIKARGRIKAGSGYFIFAGICTWEKQNIDKTITATEIIGGKIAYGDFVKIEKLAEPISEIQDEEIELNGKKI